MKIERNDTPQAENPQLKEVAQKYEAMFLNQLIGAMRKTVTKGNLVPESHADRVYQGMMDQEHAAKMAESDQIGLAKMIYEHLLRSTSGR